MSNYTERIAAAREGYYGVMTTPEDPVSRETLSTLPRVFIPARAAEIPRVAGLEELTECALRTRAYRRQIPFHLNGNRIVFTMEDLREIAQGTAYRPVNDGYSGQATPPEPSPPAPRPGPARRTAPPAGDSEERWRARRPRGG
jgi:hypothetical protein